MKSAERAGKQGACGGDAQGIGKRQPGSTASQWGWSPARGRQLTGAGLRLPRAQPVQQLISQAGSFAGFLNEERDTNTPRLNPPCLILPFRSLSLKPSGTLTTLNIDHRTVVVSSSLWSMCWGRSTLVYVLVFSISIFHKQAKALFFNRFIWIIGISEIYIHSFSPSLLEVLKQPQWISFEPKCQDVKLQAPLTLKGCFSSSPHVGHVFVFFLKTFNFELYSRLTILW